jgi:glycosyltransferase involved in cell wall biosynthesis
VSARGSLQQWGLGQKRWKKVPYWWAIERGNLKAATALHATAKAEADEIARVLPHARVFVVPNGCDPVSLPDVPRHPTRVVFLGRIHKKKGLDVLVPALSEVARAKPEVETIIAGPDEDGEWKKIERAIERAYPKPRIHYVGPLYGEEKFRLLAGSSVFVLPSHSENFGMSVVEAMACGTPVVVSRNCPWEEVVTAGAGYWIDNAPSAIASAIIGIIEDPAKAAQMGDAARELARRYSWPALGRSMAREYGSLVGKSMVQERRESDPVMKSPGKPGTP